MSTSLFCKNCGMALAAQATDCASCGSPVTSSAGIVPCPPAASPCALVAGFLLARRYRIIRQLGQGGFATVYQARDRSQRNRGVAIKQIHLETLGLQELLDASDAYNREVNHLSLLRHKHLPRIYDHLMDEQHWYIVMEYIAGKTLEERLATARRGFLPAKLVVDVGIALCDVLQHLHTQHPPLIFRDVKPANIILTRSGKLYLIDFGTTRLYRPGWKDTGPLGTPGYAAPEQYGRRAHTTPQTDIYGLGATLQTLLTGKDPLEILKDGIPPDRARHIPQRLLAAIAHMQERDDTRRPRNTAEVRQTLQEIKAQFLSQRIKAAVAFCGELLRETSILVYLSLILLCFVDLASLAGLNWRPLWEISLLFMGGFTVLRSVLKIRQAKQESQGTLTTSEKITLIWKQFSLSLPLTLLFSMFTYYVFYIITLFLSSPPGDYVDTDILAVVIIVGLGLAAALTWLLRWLMGLRAAHKQARQQKQLPLPLQRIRRHR